MKHQKIWTSFVRLFIAPLLATSVLGSTAAIAAVPLTYGNPYVIQNGYQSWAGGFLETREAGCEGNALCVSTSLFKGRDGESSTWVLLSADGKDNGKPVQRGDRVRLANKWPAGNAGNPLYQPFGGFLDTREGNCEENPLCVSTTWNDNRDSGSGIWTIEGNSDTIYLGQVVYLRNNYNGDGRFLDVRASGCEGNLLCVSASATSNRESGSGSWRFLKP
jgi:hypothetical protein